MALPPLAVVLLSVVILLSAVIPLSAVVPLITVRSINFTAYERETA